MGLLSKISDAVSDHRQGQAPAAAALQAARRPQAARAASAPQPAPAPAVTPAPIDVDAVLTSMVHVESGGGDWRTAIAERLKLLKLGSRPEARNTLADALGARVGDTVGAEQTVALPKAVMKARADNGGQLPARLGV